MHRSLDYILYSQAIHFLCIMDDKNGHSFKMSLLNSINNFDKNNNYVFKETMLNEFELIEN